MEKAGGSEREPPPIHLSPKWNPRRWIPNTLEGNHLLGPLCWAHASDNQSADLAKVHWGSCCPRPGSVHKRNKQKLTTKLNNWSYNQRSFLPPWKMTLGFKNDDNPFPTGVSGLWRRPVALATRNRNALVDEDRRLEPEKNRNRLAVEKPLL